MDDPLKLLTVLQTGGVPGCLLLFVLGLRWRWWYFASYVDDLRRERDEWRDLAKNATVEAERRIEWALDQAHRAWSGEITP